MKSIKKTYLLAICWTLIPVWIGNVLLEDAADFENLFQLNLIIGISLLAISIAGTSIGFFYLNFKKYAVLSFFGKIFFILSGIFIFKWTGSIGHPYLIFLGIAVSMIWGLTDFILLYPAVKKSNLAHK